MKAICTKRIFEYMGDRFFTVEEGTVVNYTVEDKRFIVKGVAILPTAFFAHFKVTEGKERMSYSDFEYILCNYVFTDAVLFPSEYSGVHHLIIQGWGGATIMITVNKEENVIRISFDDKQEKYENYEAALEGIRSHIFLQLYY